jgi:hypothetical protein
MDINITADDGTNAPTTKAFTIAVITSVPDIAPVIKQFTITQGNNQGRVISKTGGAVTVHATVIAKTYEWSNNFNVTDTSEDNDVVFVFNPANIDIGILTITLKATANTHSSERVLKLELVDTRPSDWTDVNNNGISDSEESGHSNNELLAGTDKKITSPVDTRILLGVMGKMGKDSGRLTLTQMETYVTGNNLTDNTSMSLKA